MDESDLRYADTLIEQLRAKIAAYNAAAIKFIIKVDSGRARSTETYADLKAALCLPEGISGHRP